MSQIHAQPVPKPDDLWLSRPPYLTIARIVAVEEHGPEEGVVSYELLDDDGYVLERVNQAPLDGAWWSTFQPLKQRYG